MTATEWIAIPPTWLSEALPAGILITDEALTVRHWCPWLERRSGLPAAGLVGRPLLEIFPELRARGLERVFERALAGESVCLPRGEHPYLLPLPPSAETPFTHMPQRARVGPLRVGERVLGTICTIVDATGQAAAEEALRQRDAYLSLAAHELRTPLTALLGRAQLLQRWLGAGAAADSRTLHSLEIVVDQGRRLSELITSVLEVARAQTGRLSISQHALDLATLARGVVERLAPTEAHPVTLEVACAALPALADPGRIEQVLRSLIGNAVKYSPGGGPIHVCAARRGSEAWLSVADKGLGIPAGELPRLFKGPFRASNAERLGVKGLGVELFVAARIVGLHGGSLTATSEEGAGSTFTVRLPLAGA